MKKYILSLFIVLSLGCSKQSFTVASQSNSFVQQATINNKVDIVWVVDSSLTMANHQANLGANFEAFINNFASRGFDFNIVVSSTDAWLREDNYNGGTCTANPNPASNPLMPYISSADCKATKTTFGEITMFRDGDIYGTGSGVAGARSGNYLISSAMSSQDIIETFKTNVKTGTRGDGSRESAFQSLRAVLRRNADGSAAYNGETHTVLSSFRRPDAFLAVIVVTDEEDQSKRLDGSNYADTQDYVNSFVSFLDGYTNGSPLERRYSFSGIVVDNLSTCQYGLHPQATQGDRYVAMANATRGVVSSICDNNFSSALNNISEKIVSLATRFKLNRKAIPDTIRVSVDGVAISNDSQNGWSYFEDQNSFYIEFHGSQIPGPNARINIDFTPATLN